MTAVAQVLATREREIVVDRVEVERSGFSGKYRWTLYIVHAHELSGEDITMPLRAFEELAGVVRVIFEPFTKDGAVTHYTLKRAKPVGERSAEAIRERRSKARAAVMGEPAPAPNGPSMAARLAAVEADLEDLKGRFALLASILDKDDVVKT